MRNKAKLNQSLPHPPRIPQPSTAQQCLRSWCLRPVSGCRARVVRWPCSRLGVTCSAYHDMPWNVQLVLAASGCRARVLRWPCSRLGVPCVSGCHDMPWNGQTLTGLLALTACAGMESAAVTTGFSHPKGAPFIPSLSFSSTCACSLYTDLCVPDPMEWRPLNKGSKSKGECMWWYSKSPRHRFNSIQFNNFYF